MEVEKEVSYIVSSFISLFFNIGLAHI